MLLSLNFFRLMTSLGPNFHFISGLPRSGSTLTAALLRQNPRFHAGMSSPVAGLFESIISQVSAGSEMASMVNEEQRARILKGVFESYYADRDEPIIFDTNRAWTAKLPSLMKLFPEAKLVCLVRDVAWIMDSMERQFQNNAFENTRIFSHSNQRATVYTRTESLAGSNSLVGFPYQALREACYSDFAERLMIVEYDMLTQRPAEVLKLIYQFLGEDSYQHDLESVNYDAPQFDSQLGLDGLHRVHKKVAPRPRQTILPPDLFEKFSQLAFWRDLKNSKAFRITSQTSESEPQRYGLPT